jgi:hypothetical protein
MCHFPSCPHERALLHMCALYDCLYLIVLPPVCAPEYARAFIRLSPRYVVNMPFATQDKMKKVLDLWSKNSTFPPLMLAKLKGIVNEVDSSAQGAYFETLFPVLPSILYHVRNCITHAWSISHPSTVYTQSNVTLCAQRNYQSLRNPLLLHGMMKTERSAWGCPPFFV